MVFTTVARFGSKAHLVKNHLASFAGVVVAFPLVLSSGSWESLGAESSPPPPATRHLEETNSQGRHNARQLDQSVQRLMAQDRDSESDTSAAACVGDRAGDVVRIKTTEFTGIPLVLRDGRVMMWSNLKDGEKWVARAVFSRDNGLTWSPPADLCEFPARKAQWGGQSGFVDKKGCLHLFGLEYYSFDFKDRSKSKSHLWHVRSQDGGKTWDPVQRIECGYGYVGCCSGAFQTKSGRIIVPVSVLAERKIGAFVSLCPYSDDHGATWKLPPAEITTSTGARDWYESGNAEPVGIQLKDGRAWLLTRSQDGFHWESFSKDNGICLSI